MNAIGFVKSRKKRKLKFNNQHKVPNEKANEIWGLPNEQLIKEVDLQYQNWHGVLAQKKTDPLLDSLKEQKTSILEEITSHPQYVEALEKLERTKNELITEELERIKEELKNTLEPYKEDADSFRSLFRLCMDELNNRIRKGIIKNDN